MKKLIFVLLIFISFNVSAQSISTGSFSGVAYTKVPSGYRFPKHTGGINANSPTFIYSPNRNYFLAFVTSGAATEVGKLVLYKSSNNQVLWRSSGIGTENCIMQADGNLVVYTTISRTNRNGDVWSSNTHGNAGAFLAIQDDGNVVIYNTNNTHALWATGTNGR